MDLALKGKVALVTGGSRGLGRAMVAALAREGMTVSICARTSDALNDAVRTHAPESLANGGRGVVGVAGDITSPEDSERWVADAARQFGGIDVLVNNAGTARPGSLAELPESAWREQFELNLFA